MRDIIKRILLEDKKERFLQYVIDELVNGTRIDYDEEEIFSPFYPLPSTHPHHFHLHTLSSNLLLSFSIPPHLNAKSRENVY